MAKILMTKDQFSDLQDALNDNDEYLRPDYSGRGMYGATCLGYTTDDGPAKFQISLAKLLGPQLLHYDEGEELDIDDLEEAMDALGSPSSDSMGRRSIYYYRSIQVEGYEQESRY